MIISDLVILGRASPDTLRDNRQTVCTAGYSNAYKFIRIYPTKIDSPLKRWNIANVEVEKDARDTRNESWKIVGSKREWLRLNEHIKAIGDLPQKDRANLIIKNLDGCVNDINDNRRSLGIIKPSVTECYFGIREGYTPSFQYSLFKRSLLGKKNFPLVPRIKYRCSNCKVNNVHDQQVIDWGFYEWLRKYPDKKEQVWKNARIGNLESDIYFLVGNQMLHRRSFMIISVLYIPKSLEDLNQAKLKLV